MHCPKCKAEMVLRTNRRDNSLFWGCSNYPACNGTVRWVDEAELTTIGEGFKPSPMQQAIFDFVKYRSGSAIINAVAGSGKTTTIVKALDYTPKDKSTVFLAFNKAIAEELKKRIPPRTRVSTLHSLGYSFIRNRLPGTTVDQNKMENLLADYMAEYHVPKGLTSLLARYASLLKSNKVLSDIDRQVVAISDYYMLDQITDESIRAIERALQASVNQAEHGIIDFDDMILMPALHPEWCDKFDFIMADECQDFSSLNIDFLLNCTSKTTRVICVGDRNQAIYGFRGANDEAMDILQHRLQAVELPLSVCYRCPTSHIKSAQLLVPEIQAREGAPEGVIENIRTEEAMNKFQKGDMIICRLNAPLIPWAFRLIKKGMKVMIKGRDIGKSINRIIEKYEGKVKDLPEMLTAVRKYRDREVERLTSLGKSTAAVNVSDLVTAIEFIAQDSKSVAEVKSKAESLFSDDVSDITLSSVHRAKGLEANRVFLAKPDAMPMDVKQHWEKKQERNIMYVAATRSKSEFYRIIDDL